MGYDPHFGQSKLHFPTKSTARFFVMVCGRRFGKTTASAMEATFYASQPNQKIWLVGLSYDKADLMFREVWQKMVVGQSENIEIYNIILSFFKKNLKFYCFFHKKC